MRCPECNKFVGMDAEEEPEVEIDIDVVEPAEGEPGEATVSGNVQINNNCAECSTALTTTSFDVEMQIPEVVEHAKEHKGEAAFSVEMDAERDERIEGKGRGAKHFYGAKGTITVTCDVDGCDWTHEAEWSDECQASHMEEC